MGGADLVKFPLILHRHPCQFRCPLSFDYAGFKNVMGGLDIAIPMVNTNPVNLFHTLFSSLSGLFCCIKISHALKLMCMGYPFSVFDYIVQPNAYWYNIHFLINSNIQIILLLSPYSFQKINFSISYRSITPALLNTINFDE